MPLRDLTLAPVLETSTSDILGTFIVPCLTEASRFDRGVGYFTSQWLRLAATGLTALAGRGGHARLIASPKLAVEDWNALVEGASAMENSKLHEALKAAVEDLERHLATEPVRALAWMVADGLLEVRLALPTDALDGDFHDKFGVFEDEEGNRVAFHGSMNDSAQAFRNYEGLDVFTSWGDVSDARRVEAHAARFDRLWDNQDVNLRVYHLPEAIRLNLVELTTRTDRPYARNASSSQSTNRWRHQDEAVAKFLAARAGILEMATGTGKTRTALRIVQELRKRREIDFVIVCAGGTDLLDQWRVQLTNEVESPLYCTYGGQHDESAFLTQRRDATWLASRDALVDHLKRMPEGRRARTLIICDEVHGFGSPTMVSSLAGVVRTFGYRLGLSATPDREYDAEGNQFLEQEIGPVLYRFPLEEAIRRGILCEFGYVPLPYIYTDDDKRKVQATVAAYHAKRKAGEPVSLEWLWRSLAKIGKEAPNKIPVFREYLRAHPEILSRTLIFVETVEFGRMVQPVLMEHTRDFHTYYGTDDQSHLRRFASAELKVLLTAHRISEGIDIQAVDSVVLFSASRARLETIQRLGRCLRTDPANPDKRALVVDFIRADIEREEGADQHADEARAAWLTELAAVRRTPDT